MPPASTSVWTTLHVEARPDFPTPIGQIVSWPGGELALGSADSEEPVGAWPSSDGRHWVELSSGTFGTTYSDLAAAAAGDVIVVIGLDKASVMHEYRSTDGLHWEASRPAVFENDTPRQLVGSDRGFLGVINNEANTVVYSPDGVGWTASSLPGAGPGEMAFATSVAATAQGYVAAGDVRPTVAADAIVEAVSPTIPIKPAAWYSSDGRSWQSASVQQGVTESLGSLGAGGDGLMAIGFAGGTPGLATYWTSSDGRAWHPAEGPLGTVTSGEGLGSVNGAFYSDGVRIIVYGQRTEDAPLQWLTSSDGEHWTDLQLTGDAMDVPWYDVQPLLVPDGIVFVAPRENWLALPTP
jgi:hypothetical protein